MTQDESYQTTVYREQGGNRYVAGSGGVFAIESGGSVAFYSGAQFTLESGMVVAGVGTTGLDLRKALISNQMAYATIAPAALDTTLAISNVPDNIARLTIIGSAALVSASMWLCAVSAGQQLFIQVVGDVSGGFAESTTQVAFSTSGCIILGSCGEYISNFTMNTSAASDCWVDLIAVLDNTWAIINQHGDVNEAAGA